MTGNRRHLSLLLQFAGLTDVALGAAIAAFGPGLVGGGDGTVEAVLMAVGGCLAAIGAGLWAWGRFRLNARDMGPEAARSSRLGG